MELIPILSLIVLVATISTFILAIGAYVLYKLRESKGRRVAPPVPQNIEAELYAPQARVIQEAPVIQQRPAAYQEQVFQESEHRQVRPAYAQTQQERAYQQAPTGNHHNNGDMEPETDGKNNKKFMKYTSEGYVPVNKATKTGENLKWR